MIAVSGRAGENVITAVSATFILRVKNPCIDPEFVSISQKELPIGEVYVLHNFKAQGGYTFTHAPFELVTNPIAHNLCGKLAYTAKFESEPIDAMTKPPMSYDTNTLSFVIYSEDLSLLGTRVITVAAHLEAYPLTKTAKPDVATTIEIVDPCLDPFSLISTAQTNPDPYVYKSQERPAVHLKFAQFTVNPDASVCPITYSCTVISGPRSDICQITDNETISTFDTASGNYSFISLDMINFPPGDYIFEITGRVGAKTATATFTMTIVDPCLTTALTINKPKSFNV